MYYFKSKGPIYLYNEYTQYSVYVDVLENILTRAKLNSYTAHPI